MTGPEARHPSDRGRDDRAVGRTGVSRVGRQRRPVPEPVNLAEFSELQASDALLDRLAGRTVTEDDLADPLTVLFSELTRDVDLETDASRRFRAVLAGRTAQDGQWREEPPSTGPLPQLPHSRAAAHRRLLDHPRGFVGRVVRAVPVTGAAAAVLLAVGGGLVAAVTGDPMAPISGINRALSPQAEPITYTTVASTIQRASAAARRGQVQKARELIASAKHDLRSVSSEQASDLAGQIARVESSLKVAPTASGGPTAPAQGRVPANATDAPLPAPDPIGTATATPTEAPSATATVASPTGSPTGAPTDLPTPSDPPDPTGVPSAPALP